MMAERIHETTVVIRGASYQLRTDQDSERLKNLASQVDDTMNGLDPKQVLPAAKVSVLASLTLAGELMDLKEASGGFRADAVERLDRLSDRLDGVL
jgi:cell division protein ZapA (FtsZ GTPase activity inhibitor)